MDLRNQNGAKIICIGDCRLNLFRNFQPNKWKTFYTNKNKKKRLKKDFPLNGLFKAFLKIGILFILLVGFYFKQNKEKSFLLVVEPV